MRLKSLELHGYKTFANRTLFEFAGAVTAIVGPNGSGKSNITDALRWVLGEQSYSLLRGKKTEDMIFSGSDQRSRAGMAAATVVLDNEAGWLPIDFAEVAITRRAYRDGQNEYLLNGQRVRLRDVSELLSKSGLAERTYTIIGQGLVDAALALKAEERRRLFEEAAGIGLYRYRREEALRRLETTLRNLDRVQDILAELEPRLKSLARQAQRAQENERIRADLRAVLRDWYGYHWQGAQVELSQARELARLQEEDLVAARQVQADLDTQLTATRETIQTFGARLHEWQQQSSQYHRQREKISRDLAVASERLRALGEQREVARQEVFRYEEEIAVQQARLDSVLGELQRLKNELEEARQQTEFARQLLQERLFERAAAEQAVSVAQEHLAALQSRHSHYQIRLAESQAQAERLSAEAEAVQQRARQAVTEKESAEARLVESQTVFQAASEERGKTERDLQASLEQVADVEAQLRAMNARRAVQQAHVTRLLTKVEVVEQAERALTAYSSGTRLVMQAVRQGQIKGVRGALSSQLEVAAEFETAIAALLGDLLDAVLLEEAAELDNILDIFQGEPARGALLTLDCLAPAVSAALIPEEMPEGLQAGSNGILGLASEMVKAPPELQAVVDLFLGQALVVRDREVARHTLRMLADARHAHPWASVVTLRGEVFYTNGVILAGQEGQTRTLGLRRQRRDLGKGLHQSETELSRLNAQANQLERRLTGLSDDREGLSRLLHEASQREKKAEIAHNQFALASQQAIRQSAWLEEQSQRLVLELERREEEATQSGKELAIIEGEISAIQEELHNLAAGLAGLPVEQYQNQVSHWELRSAVVERAVHDGNERRHERQDAYQRAGRNLSEVQTRAAAIETDVEKWEAESATLQRAEAEVEGLISAQRALIEPAEQELRAAESSQVALQQAEGEARLALNMAEHRHAQARITLARRQEALESWRRRIEDDFGLVAFEYTEETSGPTPLPLEGLVEELPAVRELSPDLEDHIKRQRALLRRLGAINPEAQSEYRQVKERYEFLTEQLADLRRADADIRQVVVELDKIMEDEFAKTFDAVAGEFRQIFIRLFGGGTARLVLTDPNDLSSSGIDIEARLPGRREQGLSLLSGGERSLTAVALVFALLRVSPTPFCVLDEVDAMLDEANVSRFRELLRELSETTQFVIITHNRNTVQVADVLYGVTMGRDSASQVISLKLDEMREKAPG